MINSLLLNVQVQLLQGHAILLQLQWDLVVSLHIECTKEYWRQSQVLSIVHHRVYI